MTQQLSRTSDEELQQLTFFYRLFRPDELAFVLDVNKVWSIYDVNRYESIAKLLREAFQSNQSVKDVRAAIDFYNSRQSISFSHDKPLETILREQHASVHLSPCISTCPICDKQLGSNEAEEKPVSIYSLKGEVQKGTVFILKCKHEKTLHRSSLPIFLYPNFTRQCDMDTYTSTSLHNSDFVYFGGENAFERSLVETYMCQLIGSSLSWNKFIDGYNLYMFNKTGMETSNWQKIFSHWFMKYYVILFDLSIGTQKVVVPRSNTDFDTWAWTSFPRLFTSLVYLWSNHKTLIGPCNSQCSACVIIDGHQKCRRRVCRAKEVYVDTPEFKALKVGCFQTPIRGSKYCAEHQMLRACTNIPHPVVKKSKGSIRQRLHDYQGRKKRNNQFGATNCRTFKQKTEEYVNGCSRSFGLLAAVSNCKVILTFSEIFRSETLREIIHLLCSTIRASDGGFPHCGVYDDGCHLVQFITNHLNRDLASTPASEFLSKIQFSVDRVHFKNHIGKWCRQYMNPDKNRMLDGINTEAAEQLFSWLKKYSPILSCLGWRRIPVFLLILFHNKNLERTKTRSNKVFDSIGHIPVVNDISLSHVVNGNRKYHTIRTPIPKKKRTTIKNQDESSNGCAQHNSRKNVKRIDRNSETGAKSQQNSALKTSASTTASSSTRLLSTNWTQFAERLREQENLREKSAILKAKRKHKRAQKKTSAE